MAGELLLDTGALVSVLDRSQVHHEKCVRFFDGWDAPVVSTEAVLTEATHLLGRVRNGRKACVEFFLDGGAVLVPGVAGPVTPPRAGASAPAPPRARAAPREKTASQVRLELLLHERWQSAPSIACLDLRQKLAEVLLDHPIENRRFRNTPGVRPRRRTRHRHERGATQLPRGTSATASSAPTDQPRSCTNPAAALGPPARRDTVVFPIR